MNHVVTEKAILTDFIKLYQDSPCLWDQNNEYYSNRPARDEACNRLLQKMKQLNEYATIIEVRKKIEYMRTAYRRENRKVLDAFIAGEEHKPTLWYYDLMSFLDTQFKTAPLRAEIERKLQRAKELSGDTEEAAAHNSNEDGEPSAKKVKTEPKEIKREECSSSEDAENDCPSTSTEVKTEVTSSSSISETEAFGRTIGLQLNELDSEQKTIAEKLISDTIYCGRLNKLTVETCVDKRVSDKEKNKK